MEKLRITSYNCRSLKAENEIVSSLLKNSDLVFLQETLINKNTSHLLDSFNSEFQWFYAPAIRNSDSFQGRSSGGLVIFYRKFINVRFSEILSSNRILGIRMQVENSSYIFLNVYLPCDYRDLESHINYISILSEISDFICQEEYEHLVILGDFNCDPNKGRFYREFSDFARSHDLIPYDILNLPLDSFTYVSSTSSANTSWLDHVLVSEQCKLLKFQIMYDYALEDHVPIYLELDLPFRVTISPVVETNLNSNINFTLWDKLTDEDISQYAENLDFFISGLDFPALACKNLDCQCESHTRELDNLYEFLIRAIETCSSFLPKRKSNKSFSPVIGWNEHCRESYNIARQNFKFWRLNGSIRNGPLFDEMKDSRNSFKKALKFCKENELKLKKNKLIENFSCKGDFWKEVRKLNPKKNPPNDIDGETDLTRIVEIFDKKYKSILNDSDCISASNIQTSQNSSAKFTLNSIYTSIFQLKPNIGWDGIHSNHIKYAGVGFKKLIFNIFNSFLIHNFLPKSMLQGEIRPILKGGSSGKHNSSNYRPVMSSSCFLKLYEYCFLPYLEKYIRISKNQFGFRPKTGCLAAISMLKETIFNYTKQNSVVHTAFLDLTKAFDRVKFDVLVRKLSETSLPSNLVKNLEFMLRNSWVSTRFGGVSGAEWLIGNGVRQGGILSPILFNFYLNDLIEKV